MKSSGLRRASSALFAALALLAFSSFVRNANAASYQITQPTDLYFEVTEPSLFTAQTQWVDGIMVDPMLWLYTAVGELIAANDDYFGLNSYLVVELAVGQYRLRAGICCGDPNRPFWASEHRYEIMTSADAIAPTPETPTTTEASTTTSATIPETTTTEPATTTTEASTTTTSTTTSTTTTVQPSTTTTPATTTTVPATTSTDATTTTTEAPAPTTTEATTTTASPVVTVASVTSTSESPRPTPQTTTSAPATSTTTTASIPTTTTTAPEPVEPKPGPEPSPVPALTEALAPAALVDLKPDQVDAIIDLIVAELDELSPQELEVLSQVLSQAPDEVKKAFEDEVDIFAGGFDNYTPVGSVVTVGQRRSIVAATAAAMVAASTATATRRH